MFSRLEVSLGCSSSSNGTNCSHAIKSRSNPLGSYSKNIYIMPLEFTGNVQKKAILVRLVILSTPLISGCFFKIPGEIQGHYENTLSYHHRKYYWTW